MMRALIVDDEPAAREVLRALLTPNPRVQIVGEAVDGPTAVEAITALRPDLVLLDIQMPGCDGFDVLKQVPADHFPPVVVFVTAYDRYALRAFEAHAQDYLLKPVDRKRLYDALSRAEKILQTKSQLETYEQLMQLVSAVAGQAMHPAQSSSGGSRQHVERLQVKEGDRYVLVNVDDIDWVESAGNQLTLHVGSERYLIRKTMTALAAELDPTRFARIHRSTLVNIARVKELRQEWHGDFDVLLQDGTVLRMSRNFRDGLLPRS